MILCPPETLKSKRRYAEAGRVLQEYGRDIDGAVATLVEGNAFVEAIRLVRSLSLSSLLRL